MKIKEVIIKGNGSSIWGKSKGEYKVNSIFSHTYDSDDNYGTVNVYGENLDWFQYTDSLIEKEVNLKLKKQLEKLFERKIKNISWSEQGMQPDKGWNFDISFYKEIK